MQQTSYKIAKDLLSEPTYNLIDVKLPALEKSNIFANLNKATPFRQPVLNPQNILKSICLKKLSRLILAHFNIDSNGNKFDSLVTIVNKNIDVFLISETKIDSLSPYQRVHHTI